LGTNFGVKFGDNTLIFEVFLGSGLKIQTSGVANPDQRRVFLAKVADDFAKRRKFGGLRRKGYAFSPQPGYLLKVDSRQPAVKA